ncbi:HTH-type transcriptional regulator YidZ [Aeromonas caviae]|uniref:HTH-type transcriptional regulator YidZ n=1 Tax=Aeromonas caviae TaxID=648 RepID=UPI0029D60930|nr:HTH-type transcriptional regulator YidZ [Aeromonas caviae]MDX7612282.1 HTH-type transcriptional regulator YidZ [Aeromonas caviae]MDX7713426.1 HTH-type transcriptional regulator YidZ [Aeromonas caviae]
MIILYPLGIDLYLVAVPRIAQTLQGSEAQIHTAFSIYLLGMAATVLPGGMLADRHGRRPVVLGGALIFVVASLVAAEATGIAQFYLGRFWQGVGAGALYIMTFTVLRDVLSQARLAMVLSLINGVICVIPVLAPVLGYLILSHFEWRGIFVGMALLAAISALVNLRLLKETRPARQPAGASPLALLGTAPFMQRALLTSASVTAILVYVSVSPLVLMTTFGLPPEQYTRLMMAMAGVSMSASFLTPLLLRWLGKLRDWFGDPLFVRVRQGLQPTNLSLTLAEELKTWFQLTESISTLNREAIPEGARFSLVMESPFGISFLSELPTTIYQKYPHSVVRMLGWDHHSLNDIVNGEADLGFCARETHGRSHARVNRLPYYIDHEVLFCDRPVVFLRKDHPLLGQTWSLTRFLACPQVSVVWEASDSWALDDLLEDEGHRRQVPIMVASFEQALHIAAQKSHELIAVVPSYCADYAARHHPDLIPMPLPLEESLYAQLEIAFILLWHKRHNQDAKVMWLRGEIRRLYGLAAAGMTRFAWGGPMESGAAKEKQGGGGSPV